MSLRFGRYQGEMLRRTCYPLPRSGSRLGDRCTARSNPSVKKGSSKRAGKKVGSDREKQGSGKQPPNGRQESRQSFSRDKNSKLAKATVRRVGKLQDDLEPTLEASVPFLHTAEEMIKAHKEPSKSCDKFMQGSSDGSDKEEGRNERKGRSKGRGRGAKKALPFALLAAHSNAFHAALKAELAQELATANDRLENWTRAQLQDAGLALFDLQAQADGTFFGDSIVRLALPRRGTPLPYHNLAHGDWVLLTGNGERHEGVVMDSSANWLRIALPEDAAADIHPGPWRLDLYFNTTAHYRCVAALQNFKNPNPAEQPRRSKEEMNLRNALLAFDASNSLPPLWATPQDRLEQAVKKLRESNVLNRSQVEAVKAGLGQTLTLWQGPPGTGKTKTLVNFIATAAPLLGPGRQILAACASNIAVDNLVLGLRGQGVNVVRLGQPVKVMPELQELTLAARVSAHPDGKSAAAIREKARELSRTGRNARGAAAKQIRIKVQELYENAMRLEEARAELILQSAQVVAATCVGVGDAKLNCCNFKLCVLDEATQATEPASLIPLLRGCESAVLVGDQCQLPPTVVSRVAEEGGLGISLFQRLQRQGLTPELLDTQYRMHPQLADFPNNAFYFGRLKSAPTPDEREAPAGFPWAVSPSDSREASAAFVDCRSAEQRTAVGGELGTSFFNQEQAALVLEVVKSLLAARANAAPRALPNGVEDIAVISPYSGQVKEIRRQIGELPMDLRRQLEAMEVKSVDGFQGREKELVIFSSVRCNPARSVGFLSDQRRLNVALTRAKRGLIVIGCPETLSADRTWAAWLKWVGRQRLITPASDFEPTKIVDTASKE